MNRLKPLRILCVATLFAVSTAAAQQAEETETRVTHRVALPLDGSPIDLSGLMGPERTLVLHGTVTSSYDGAEIDPFARRAESARFEADGPFVILPRGAEVLEEDVVAHRYVVRLADSERPTLSFAIARLAARQLQTRSEAAAALSGRIEVQVHGPVPAVVPNTPVIVESVPTPEESTSPWLFGLLALLPIGAWVGWRRRSRRWQEQVARARRAVRGVEREATRLGPAFDDVVTASHELLERAQGMARHAREIEGARKRIEGTSSEAERRRERLGAEAKTLEANMEALVARLEGVAAELAAQVAGHARVTDLEVRLGEMASELDVAISADREVA